ncbi:MAG: glycine oxidase ThiO [Gammaproteobacteria bacterium]|nr:glycine oxidase ThiO [Gammaproteobacteria bacterium]
MTDCLVIGGGLIGMLTARELARAGMRVTLVERSATGRESSWAGGGILSPLYPWRYPDAVTALAGWSQRIYPALAAELADETGVDPEWTRNGLLMLDADGKVAAQAWAERAAMRLDVIDRDAVLACEPGLGEPPQEALWMPDIAQIRNPRLLRAVRLGLVSSGVEIREGVDVMGFIVRDGRIAGVETAAGKIPAESVVVAAGAWSGRLLAGLGVALDVAPVRGQMIMFHARPGVVSRIVLSQGRYLIPRRDGRVLAGSTVEHAGFDKSATAEALAQLRQAAVALVPALARYDVERHWAGLRPGSPEGVPFIGEHPQVRGLFVNAGHFRNGVVMGPASARLLADLMQRRAPIIDPLPYALSG